MDCSDNEDEVEEVEKEERYVNSPLSVSKPNHHLQSCQYVSGSSLAARAGHQV